MEPRTFHVDRLVDEDGEEKEIDVRLVFSHQGPPHLELLQTTGDGIYGQQYVGGLHHVAVLESDPGARRDELLARGLRLTPAVHGPDGNIAAAYLDAADLEGVRLELLDASIRDASAAGCRIPRRCRRSRSRFSSSASTGSLGTEASGSPSSSSLSP